MKFVVINGSNLNLLGIREPEIYGSRTYADLVEMIKTHAKEKQVEVSFVQSNHEGDLVDAIQQAYFDKADGIIINPGAYTHTSIAIMDAVKAVRIPTIEVHISKVSEREAYRQVSYIREVAEETIAGLGFEGYNLAMDHLIEKLGEKK